MEKEGFSIRINKKDVRKKGKGKYSVRKTKNLKNNFFKTSLLVGDVSSAWRIWSFFAEVSLVRAFVVSGGPVSGSSFRLGRGAAGFKTVSIGGPVVRKVRSDLGSGDGQAVHLFKYSSVSRVIVLRRRLGSVLSVLDGISLVVALHCLVI